MLHKLSAAEVQDIMGHELGHYYRHYLVADRFRWVTLTLGALIGILTVQLFNFTNAFWGLFVLASVASGFSWLAALPWHRHGQAIEYLCDDVGSQVHGIVPSINGLLINARHHVGIITIRELEESITLLLILAVFLHWKQRHG